MRVLVSTTGGTGHIHPIVPVVRSLQRAGHEVVWATAAEACAALDRLGFDARPAGISVGERIRLVLERRPAVFSLLPAERRPTMFAAHFAETAAPAMARDLGPLLDHVRPDLVVHDVAELAAPPMSTVRGIRHVAVAFSGELPEAVRTAAVAAIAPLWDEVGLAVPDDLALFDHAYLHPFPPSFGQRPGAPTVHDVRPVGVDGAGEEAPPEWLTTMGADRPLVYVTYGTEMGPQAPWPALIGALQGLDVDALVTVGGQVDPTTLAPLVDHRDRDRIRIERYVPQSFVLPRARVVVSHAGAGSMLAAASAGLPQLVVPLGADQFENAAAVVGAGAAVALTGDEVAATTVGTWLARLLDEHDVDVTMAAGRVAREIAAMPHPDEVAALLAAR